MKQQWYVEFEFKENRIIYQRKEKVLANSYAEAVETMKKQKAKDNIKIKVHKAYLAIEGSNTYIKW